MDIVISKNSIPIRLTDERWAHITEEHCDLAGLRLEVLDTNLHSTGYQGGEEKATQAYGGLYVEEPTTKPTQVAE